MFLPAGVSERATSVSEKAVSGFEADVAILAGLSVCTATLAPVALHARGTLLLSYSTLVSFPQSYTR